MDKYDMEVIEKRAFNNAVFATGCNRLTAESYVLKIYKLLNKTMCKCDTNISLLDFVADKSNYVKLVQSVDLNDFNNEYSKTLNIDELTFMQEYLVYGKHLISIGELVEITDHIVVHPKDTSAYKLLCQTIIGQEEMKHTICRLGAVFQYNKKREENKLPSSPIHKVFAFIGPPGTAKTTSAMFFAQMMKEEKILSGCRIAYVTGTELKAKFIGQTSERVHEIFKNHDIIIIDEAYSLVNSNETDKTDNFSQEALAQLCIEVEEHSNDKLIIFAGYGGDINEKNNKMKKFLNENPGISSRITFTVNFLSYSSEEMLLIFDLLAKNAGYELEYGWEEVVKPFFADRVKLDNFGNGREARKLLEHAMTVAAENYIDWYKYKRDCCELNFDKEEKKLLTVISCDNLKEAVNEFINGERFVKP